VIRTLALFSLLASPLVAQAGMITMGNSYIVRPTSNSPINITLDLNWLDSTTNPIHRDTGLTIAGVGVSETPLVWTINAANAADFGMDWAVALQWALDWRNQVPDRNHLGTTWQYGSQAGGDGALQLGRAIGLTYFQRIANFRLDHIDIEQTYWVDFPWLRKAEFRYRLVGEGIVVPEPSTFIMGLLVSLYASGRRYRRP
jgi:hypothetical protein